MFSAACFVGEKPGLGQTVKLANNLMSAASLAIAAEAMAMGVKAGVDPAVMLEVLNASSGRNSATQDKIPKHVLNRKFDFGFANALSFKDVRLCLDEAEALGVPMVVGAAVRQMLSITNQVHGPDADCTDMVRVVEDWAGCEIGAAKRRNSDGTGEIRKGTGTAQAGAGRGLRGEVDGGRGRLQRAHAGALHRVLLGLRVDAARASRCATAASSTSQ